MKNILLFISIILVINISAQTNGCTDTLAYNYNPLATVDDSSCCLNNTFEFTQFGQSTIGTSIVATNTSGDVMVGNSWNTNTIIVYEFDGVNWQQLGQNITGFYSSVDINSAGDVIVIGYPYNDINGTDAGLTQVWNYNGVNWLQVGQDIFGEAAGDRSGYSVSIDSIGSTIVIGAPWNDGGATDGGHVRVFDLNSANWVQLGLDIDGNGNNSYLGTRVDISSDGSTIVFGVPSVWSSNGYASVFNYNGLQWTQVGQNLGQNNILSGVYYPYSQYLSLSADGNTVAISTYLPSSNPFSSSFGGTQIEIYTFDGAIWNNVNVFGEGIVSMSGDGNTLATALYWNETDADYWDVLIYRKINNQWMYLQTLQTTFTSLSLNYDGDTLAVSEYGTKTYYIEPPCAGCTDSTMYNYNATVTYDDGSCIPFIYGCIDTLADNFDTLANTMDSSCIYYGCTDSAMLNYDAAANVDDGSCIPYIYGCTDTLAYNYNILVNTEDGTCCFLSDTSYVQIGNLSFGSYEYSSSGDGSIVGKIIGGSAAAIQIFTYDGIQIGQDIISGNPRNISLNYKGDVIAVSCDTFVNMYKFDGVSWMLLGQSLNIFRAEVSISLDGNTIAVADSTNYNYTGTSWSSNVEVEVYTFNGAIWTQLGQSIVPPNNIFYGLNLSGNGLTLAFLSNVTVYPWSAASILSIYEFNGGNWIQKGQNINTFFSNVGYELGGNAISLSEDGNTLALGGTYSGIIDDSNVYEYIGGVWVGSYLPVGSTWTSSTGLVSVSADGNTVAVTDGNNEPDGDFYSNEVSIYRKNNTQWLLLDEIWFYPEMYYVGLNTNGDTLNLAGSGYSKTYVLKPPCAGCLDSAALNYDSTVVIDANNCVYACDLVLNTFTNNTSSNTACDGFAFSTPTSINPIVTYSWADTNGMVLSIISSVSNLCNATYIITVTDSGGCSVTDTLDIGYTNGCTDALAYNYYPLATIDDGSCCYVAGCTEPTMFNYDSLACYSDSSCVVMLYGCLDSLAFNYDTLANTNDSSCCYISGCTDSTMFNYDPTVCFDDSSNCIPFIYGCTDTLAINYDTLSNSDNGSCLYCDLVFDNVVVNQISSAAACDGWIFTEGLSSYLPLSYTWNNGVVINSNTNLCSGYYTITITDAMGCIIDTTITIGNGGIIVYGCTDMLACNFDATATNDDGSCAYATSFTDAQIVCDTLNWIDGVTYTTANNTATYITTNTAGCDSVITLDLTVTGNPVAIITQNGIDLEVTSAATYIWNTNETSQTITPTTNGWYWVIATDVDGCVSDTAFYEVINVVSSVGEILSDKVMIYPNPTKDYLVIETECIITEVRVIDAQARVVDVLVKGKTINVSGIANGLYFVEVYTDKGLVRKQFVKQN
tara:strand:+ start:284 stop:4414 length:4131 start_codon:yes stop_codon:yes gene_type:complete